MTLTGQSTKSKRIALGKKYFNGAFEMKSENGNFGIRIEVQRGRNNPF